MDTPKPMQGPWTLKRPDGKFYVADSPIACLRAEQAERDALQAATALCEKHPPLGARNQCVICSGEKLQAALSQISYLCEEPNEMGVSTYDVYYDEDAVVEQVRKKLGKSPT